MGYPVDSTGSRKIVRKVELHQTREKNWNVGYECGCGNVKHEGLPGHCELRDPFRRLWDRDYPTRLILPGAGRCCRRDPTAYQAKTCRDTALAAVVEDNWLFGEDVTFCFGRLLLAGRVTRFLLMAASGVDGLSFTRGSRSGMSSGGMSSELSELS